MTVEDIVNVSQPLWPTLSAQWQKPSNGPASKALSDQSRQDDDPDPPAAAPAVRPWPRVFPGL